MCVFILREIMQLLVSDSLVARADDVSQEGSLNQDRPKATETCVYCFSDHTAAPHSLSQQSGAQQASCVADPHNNGLLHHPVHTHPDKSRPFRIICSPTQTSMWILMPVLRNRMYKRAHLHTCNSSRIPMENQCHFSFNKCYIY